MTNKRTEYTIGVKSDGLDNLSRLIAELDKAGVETDEFKAQAAKLRRELADMQGQQSLIDKFVSLKKETQSAAKAFEDAQAHAQNLGREIAATDAPTKKQAAEFARARTAVNSAKDAYQATQLRLQAMRATLAENNIETTGLSQKQVALREGVRGVESAVAAATTRLQTLGDVGPKAANETAAATEKATKNTREYAGALTQVAGAVAGVFAVDRAWEYAKSVQQVADEYKNLEARIRLSVGPQADLRSAVESVGRVAIDTNTQLDATAQLYGRLAASAAELNISNEQALSLTKTVNQAIQVGGASAQASEASVTQLVQALQSGVLRGDEFNSIMEQSPRLAKALADGLGVPVGALRGLAEQGQLTSAKVVEALKGQSDAIAQEFATLPLTVGRALTNLETQWTLFVGSLAGGSTESSIAAQGINALANNLDTLAGIATRAGAALTAALAVQGVMALRAFAAEMLTTGKAASLMALELSKVPKVISISIAVTGLEVGYQIGTMLHENFELARKLGIGLTGFMQALVNDVIWLKDTAAAIFTDDTIEEAFDRYIQRGKEMDQILADMWKDAEQAPTQISQAANAGTSSLQQMGDAGAKAGSAVAAGAAQGTAGVGQLGKASEDARSVLLGLAQAINLKTAPDKGLGEIVKELTNAKLRGEDLEQHLRQKLPAAIENLSGAELVKFRAEFLRSMDQAKSALQEAIDTKKPQAEIDALRVKVDSFERATRTGLELVAAQAAQNLGLDVPAAFGKMSQGFRDAQENMSILIRQLPELKVAGVDTGAVVGQALAKMLDGAKNQAEIDAVITRIKTLRTELGDKVADGLLDQATEKTKGLKVAFDDAIPGTQSLEEAMRKLGITSDAELKKVAASTKDAYDTLFRSGTASAREVSEGFKKAADAAIASNNGIAPSWVKAEASLRGYEVAVDSAGKATLKLQAATDQAADSNEKAVRSIDEHRTALERLNAERERGIAAQEKALDLETRELKLQEAKRTAGTIKDVDAVPSFESQEQADAWKAEWERQYQQKNPFTTRASGALGSFQRATTHAEWQAEVDAMKLRNTMKGNGNAETSSKTPLESMRQATYINNITLPGVGTVTTRHTDAQSAQVEVDFLTQLAQAKSASA
ncbi:MAG: tape measure protein [Comamonas sp.]|nr:tape measure protein [Comamonas sp.]